MPASRRRPCGCSGCSPPVRRSSTPWNSPADADRPGQGSGPQADLLLDLVHELEGVEARPVPLVDDGEDRDAAVRADLEELEGLRLETLGGVDEHHRRVHGREHPVGVLGEVRVTGGVDQVDHVVAVVELQGRRGDGDAAGPLHLHPVRHRAAPAGLAVHRARLRDHVGVQGQGLGQGRLAGVGVADDRERAAGAGVGGGHFRPKLPQRGGSISIVGGGQTGAPGELAVDAAEQAERVVVLQGRQAATPRGSPGRRPGGGSDCMAVPPTEVCAAWVVAGKGPPWCMARLTATPVGQPFQTSRPARSRSSRTSGSTAAASSSSACMVAVRVPPSAEAASSASSGPSYSTMTDVGPEALGQEGVGVLEERRQVRRHQQRAAQQVGVRPGGDGGDGPHPGTLASAAWPWRFASAIRGTSMRAGATSRTAAASRSSRPWPRGRKSSPGLVQNCPTPRVNEPTISGGDRLGPGRQCSRRHEHRVEAAHLGVEGNGHVAVGGDAGERRPAALGPGERAGCDRRVLQHGRRRSARPRPGRRSPRACRLPPRRR